MSADLNKIEGLKCRRLFALPDLLTAGIFIMAVALAVCVFTAAQPAGKSVKVYVGGELYAEYLLERAAEYNIEDKLTVIIEGGACRVADSICRDHICERRPIKNAGDSLFCAPQNILIVVSGTSDLAYII